MLEDPEERIAQVMIGLMRARQALHLDPQTFDDLIGAVMVEVDLSMQVAEETALERKYRRTADNVVSFPGQAHPGCTSPI